MANNIKLAKNFTDNLDEIYQKEACSACLLSDSSLVKEGNGANEIVFPKLQVGKLGDYDRNSGYTKADVNVDWETKKFNYDRGTKIEVDAMDNEETMNIAFGMAGAELERTAIIPEDDAFTFAKIASIPNISKVETGADLTTGEEVLKALNVAVTKMDEDQVPSENRILFWTPTLKNMVDELDSYKSKKVLDGFTKIQSVPQSRFFSAIDLLSGKDTESAGGFKKNASAKDINFLIVHKPAVIKFNKHHVSNIIPASENQNADADMLKFRKYGLVEVYENKVAGIYLHHKAS